MNVLLVEDDEETAAHILRGLTEAGHQASRAADGEQGLVLAGSAAWDLLIVDRMLPKLDGLSLVKRLREMSSPASVLFLTTLGGVEDRVHGLNAGADDYLVKPFALSELLARVAALGRRARRPAVETVLKAADLEMDLLSRIVTRDGMRVDLLPREFRLLEYLMRHADQVVTRAMLLENVWEVHFDPNTSVVETHVSRLRSAIERPGAPALIHTVRGVGYTLRVTS